MACCVIGALILSQFMMLWRMLQRVLGMSAASPTPAHWSPDAAAQPVRIARLPRGRGLVTVMLWVFLASVTASLAVEHVSHARRAAGTPRLTGDCAPELRAPPRAAALSPHNESGGQGES